MSPRGLAPVAERLVGRDRELAILHEMIHGIDGRAGALVISGAPGMGKSALLRHAAAADGVRVVTARGVESEITLPFVALADLLLPLREFFPALPISQRVALESALAISAEVPGPPNPYAVCAATLTLMAVAGEQQPLLVLVDDLHWLDSGSLQVLQFVARRLGGEHVLIVLAGRDVEEQFGGRVDLPLLQLEPLTTTEAVRLVHERTPEARPHVVDAVVEAGGGNPLALVEMLAALPPTQLRGDEPLTSQPPPAVLLDRAWAERLSGLPAYTKEALTLVAACEDARFELIETALDAAGLPIDALAPAEELRLILSEGDRYAFRHPVLRAVVLRTASATVRRTSFRVLAEVTTGAVQAWYLAASSTGPDRGAEVGLVAAARDAHARSAFGTSARTWRRAADFASGPPRRVELLIQAAVDAMLAGSFRDAIRWTDHAAHIAPDACLRADVGLARGRAYAWSGDPDRALSVLLDAAADVDPYDPDRAELLRAEAVFPAVLAGDMRRALKISDALVASDPEGPAASTVVPRAFALCRAGDVAGAEECLTIAMRRLADAEPLRNAVSFDTVAECLISLERFDAARGLLDRVVQSGRVEHVPVVLPHALSTRSRLERWTGRWAAAHADASEAHRWATELGMPTVRGLVATELAMLDGACGRLGAFAQHVREAEEVLNTVSMGGLEIWLLAARGLEALSRGESVAAAGHLDAAFVRADRGGLANPSAMPFAADRVEAHFRAGDRERALDALQWLTDGAARTGLSWQRAVTARCRGLLSTERDEALEFFDVALAAHEEATMPFERARTLLCLGETLRRFRRPAAAREPLTDAADLFRRLGAAPWTERAETELSAAGLRPVHKAEPAPALAQLSPQEWRVAQSVGSGLSNAEAASALFLSTKTVEAHLTRVYRKLGVRSRSEVARLLAVHEQLES
ncbi:helix-turn-helix transcriptional regulator [Cryptosporangium sp. NPDC051539]|uniref:helix-turn-helix transcriptional regulator n=1 Tax=Cryptosporangium sp. NPDC051539 TaxID=3363962 RepID=UPI0037A42C4C